MLGEAGLGQLSKTSPHNTSNSDPYFTGRLEAFRRDILELFLLQDSGTLILVLGFVGADHSGQQQRTFQSLLQEVEGYDETVKPKGKAIAKQGKPELLTYITHKTALGQPFTRHALDRSGFDSNQIGATWPTVLQLAAAMLH